MYLPVILTSAGKSYGPPCPSYAAASRQMEEMLKKHMEAMPTRHLLARTVLGIGEVQIGGATFRIEVGQRPPL